MAAANFKVLRGLLPIAFLAVFVAGDAPKLLNKSELDELVNQGKRVVANFVQDNCPKCATFGPEFLKAASKLVDDKDVEFVLVKDKDVHIRHGVSTTPSILYFREKTPILFTDEMKADHIVNFVQNSQSAFTKSLTDDSFEHLTQAATGATTGDWLVLFLDHNQEESLMLIPTLEAAAEVLKNKVNVATVDVIQEPFLAERFEVDETPSGALTVTFGRGLPAYSKPLFHCFRLGRMYGFHLPQFDVSSVVSFATGWYKNSRAIPVAVPKSPFYRKESDEWAGFEQDLTLDSILAFIAEEEAAKGGTTVNTKEKL
ncbi:protein disulfide-isomerase-like, partial [Saccoglossus kowalevskii]|uniref:Uncharacterized protein LOC102803488 n=1 Tax=Saccoglossus kowalevskii TaxID=10224 RepID=A0ABM0N1H2_SACKO|nr:PREDICTED: uncharacterized protein LOC102803488 [Saccoglossus kowalevskii]